MTKFEPDCNGLSRVCNDARWYLVDCTGRQVGASYSFIHECDNGLYKVEKGSRKNLMRADGSLVMRAWHHEVEMSARECSSSAISSVNRSIIRTCAISMASAM